MLDLLVLLPVSLSSIPAASFVRLVRVSSRLTSSLASPSPTHLPLPPLGILWAIASGNDPLCTSSGKTLIRVIPSTLVGSAGSVPGYAYLMSSRVGSLGGGRPLFIGYSIFPLTWLEMRSPSETGRLELSLPRRGLSPAHSILLTKVAKG